MLCHHQRVLEPELNPKNNVLGLFEEEKPVFAGQVIKVGEPLPDVSENHIVWESNVKIRKIRKDGTVRYDTEFAKPPDGDNPIDEIVRRSVIDAVAKFGKIASIS